MEITKKKNTDYSASAVNMVNPPEVRECLIAQRARIEKLADLESAAQSFIPKDIKARLANLQAEIAIEDKGIRGYIDTFGSYQGDEGIAVKQRRESISYKPELVRQYAPAKVASFVIIEAVDGKALEALVKSGQITAEQAKQCGIIEEKFTYIIK